ncbi:hypothetical protein BJ138DRAFT_1208110 [Hygrophoropsis aurantiaca]|uniref:Uncharacterized protein n=1 Tax=Hygrophoropsis aurantiaca TaxID=72124 RepID=A0ACB8A3Z1_9AGAM|nr:hypothetical protein BJ138DRAFT_1208110 [Hygrophoropsis aurantiaca]
MADADADPTSQSNYVQIATTHVAFDWTIDYDRKIITGSAVHKLLAKTDNVNEVVFDTADLDIEEVKVGEQTVQYTLKPKHAVMGSALHVPLGQTLASGATIVVSITYATTKYCTALQWLAKEQTQSGTFPSLFSQCQPIYARALAPVQDTPSVKLTYSAEVTSVLPVLLSARRISPPSEGPAHGGKVIGVDKVKYTYDQPVPIPSYLLAIAAGNFRYRPFTTPEGKTWTSGVWAEPELIDAAHWEFNEDTTRYLATAESLVGPYRFGVYDLLVLPPSFPYGGMENPCLSFLTPTLLAGDRSLTSVVIHELTHSYFGNGVTHAHASHFWLNEGWTTYIERTLQQLLDTPATRGMSFVIGYNSLVDALSQFINRPKYQRLVIPFDRGEDPDSAYSRVPYDKGANFVLHLERTLGGLDAFLPYVRNYVNTFMGHSITTDQWKEHLYTYYRRHDQEKIAALDSVKWDEWLNGEGMTLPVVMEYDLTLVEAANKLADRWDASRGSEVSKIDFKPADLDTLNANQRFVFLERLQSLPTLPTSHMLYLDELYQFSVASSPEIRLRFYTLVLRNASSEEAKKYAPEAAKWVVGEDSTGIIKGRMKFCRPVFRAIHKVTPDLAVSTFQASKEAFHPIAQKLIKEDLGLQ